MVFPSAVRPLLMENLMISDKEFDKIISKEKRLY
jgi:hypothetical protein